MELTGYGSAWQTKSGLADRFPAAATAIFRFRDPRLNLAFTMMSVTGGTVVSAPHNRPIPAFNALLLLEKGFGI